MMQISSVDVSQGVLVAPVGEMLNKLAGPEQSQAVEAIASNSMQMSQMVTDMQNYIKKMNTSLEFSTYGEHGEKIAIIVTDKDTGEVIREIPPKEIQDLYVKMSEVSGMIFNKKV